MDGRPAGLTCISEEAMADPDFPARFLCELECSLASSSSCRQADFLACRATGQSWERCSCPETRSRAGGRGGGRAVSWQLPLPTSRGDAEISL